MDSVVGTYFDRVQAGVGMLDASLLMPPDPQAAWLGRPTVDGWSQARRLELARLDLDRLATGWRPSPEDLVDAPILQLWRFADIGRAVVVEGIVQGHPGLADGRIILTSAIIAMDIETMTWARTVSRFYRLEANST